MSVLIYAEATQGGFKKSTYEAISYGVALATKLGVDAQAVAIGSIETAALVSLGNYGVKTIHHCVDERVNTFNPIAYASVVAQAAQTAKANVVILSASFSGKGLAPRVAIKLKAALAENVIEMPDTSSGFKIKKGAYSGKAIATVSLQSEVKVISMVPNSYKVVENRQTASVNQLAVAFGANDFNIKVKETIRSNDKVALPDAELVISAGRGMKGPENWGMIEELANTLGAATACSKPVSDAGWRPHSEHVGQTGIAISPNLYIAIGISGAIQHLAGVSSSKVIVVVNKDPEAPFFKAADYGIVGDAFEIVPKLISAAKTFKASQN
ncbi:MAG: hypothetical protein RIQ89_177 [Bacteroidota bacterium]|jgi:electron transfer flavoprotein alpha subunit